MINLKWIVLALAVAMYALVIAKQDKKVIFTSVTALLVIGLGIAFPGAIFTTGSGRFYALTHAFSALVNWNVLMIYVGSMTIAALFLYSKVPAKIADWIVKVSPSTGLAIVLILAMTGIISIFVENVATVLVMAPIALSLCKKLKMNPTMFMVGLAVMSNLEGTATLVGDPPSMIFASYAGYTFNDFFVHSGRLSIFFVVQTGLLAGCLFFYAVFARLKEKTEVDGEPIISVVPAILLLSLIFGLAAISFIPNEIPFLSGGFVMVLGALGVLWYIFSQKKSGSETWELIKSLDWETIAFLIGIFVVVGAISETGLLKDFADFLARITGGSKFAGFILILAVSIFISGFVDNVPYIIVMLPVAGNMAESMGINRELFLFALLIGSCLGGNLTPFGASANVVAMGIVKKEGHPMSFAKWLKLGGTFTLITTAAAAIVLWILWA
ncbi:SLC13 family permease [Treponema ruminis]|uniref:Na+/H+ antiporter NhaD/arsenite permease-like protein n=1 Tax=Treponema ruminis TaxID=744515 RepID=A0A7W8LN38_9SPIR|nr:SLC13 family permease [Treponema ruminis]MBB5227206.1 Na+/H+ antiporter NhaD/arsenite permease-like protein [Treponema ruminis]